MIRCLAVAVGQGIPDNRRFANLDRAAREGVEEPSISLSSRVVRPELMDALELQAEPHRLALSGLRRINRFSRSAAAIAAAILEVIPREQRQEQQQQPPLEVLDIGCGSGDVTAGVYQRLQRAGVDARICGWDRSATAIETAVGLGDSFASPPQLRFTVRDAFAETPDRFDVVYCSLFLHHFETADARRLLRQMQRLASRAVIVDDLVRSRTGLLLAAAGCRLLSRSPIVHADGPQSVRAAFTLEEIHSLARSAGLMPCVLRRHWPQRFTLTWCRA